jgi:hypothetical protein
MVLADDVRQRRRSQAIGKRPWGIVCHAGCAEKVTQGE